MHLEFSHKLDLLSDEELVALEQEVGGFITENKRQLFDKILAHRTKHITVVLEDIFQPQNASAVMRSCDCFGVNDLHVIEMRNEYVVNKDVVKGSSKWVDLYRHTSTEGAYESLRNDGYKVVATSPHAKSMPIHELPIDDKIAIVFGTEMEGLTDVAIEQADERVYIPMFGFTESFNLSVSAAICLNQLVTKLHQSDVDWQYSDCQKLMTKILWNAKMVNRGEIFLKNVLADR